MIWKLRGKGYVSPPYSIEPGVQGWSVWVTTSDIGSIDVDRIGRDITTLRAAKALAELHAKGEKRVVT